MDINDEMFVGATSSSQCCVWDMKSLRAPLEQRDSIIRHIKCIRLMNDNAGYAISGVEGRVSIDYLRNNYDVPEDGFTFKCHRARRNNSELVYPVNSMRFHRGYETLVTGGSDRYVNVWCVKRKKRLTQLKRLPSAVSALSFSHDESLFAIGYSTAPAEEEQQPGLPALSGVILRRVDQWAFGPRAQE
ncbi:hypothetical protein O3M35_004194 [Rhynocoris fuscipes]|uniref:Mitotic checkpoint protein BUB3 n=1 Tax=Rhynocoris fuscipes TaxID=488301 RepID=A0AAW1CJ71_9HEMI